MVEFHYETKFSLQNEVLFSDWISRLIISESKFLKQIDFVFCDDSYLLSINKEYLNHDSLTDIITFDYTDGKYVAGDIYISVERVKENSSLYKVGFQEELKRVMSHGILHLLGYDDKTEKDVAAMRTKEEEKMAMFHVEQ